MQTMHSDIKARLEERRKKVYYEMRTKHNSVFREVVANAECVCLRNRVDDSKLAADIEMSMMMLAHDLMET